MVAVPFQHSRWNGTGFVDIADATLGDEGRRAIGVAAGDIDGDGREEIYILNTDTFAGRKQFGDRLFDFQDGEWVDLFSLPQHQAALNLTSHLKRGPSSHLVETFRGNVSTTGR